MRRVIRIKFGITLYKDDWVYRCWRADRAYQTIFGLGMPYGKIYLSANFNGGEITRHLCGDSHCINPIHIKGGSQKENAQDRAEKHYYTRDIKDRMSYEMKRFDIRCDLFADLLYADSVSYRIRDLIPYGYIDKENIKLAKEVFTNILIPCEDLAMVSTHTEMLERSRLWIGMEAEETSKQRIVFQHSQE